MKERRQDSVPRRARATRRSRERGDDGHSHRRRQDGRRSRRCSTKRASRPTSCALRLERYRRIMASTRLVMGHELKKPTTAISGYLELAHEDVRRGRARRRARLHRQGARRVRAARRAQRVLSRPAQGGRRQRRRPCVEQRRRRRGRSTRRSSRLPSDLRRRRARARRRGDSLPPAAGESQRAQADRAQPARERAQLFAGHDSAVRVEAEVSRDMRGAGDGELLKLRVIDQGEGIAPNDMKRVFMPFVRLDDGQARRDRDWGSRWFAAWSTCATATCRFEASRARVPRCS